MIKKPRWTPQEVTTLTILWPSPWENLEKALPNKTLYAIKTKSNRLGLRRNLETRYPTGEYIRTRKLFSLENFEDGYVDNKGRFRVWLPEHPRAYESGYIFRSIAAYYFYHGVVVPEGSNIHHIDGNRLNDSRENLEMILHSEHTILSNTLDTSDVTRTCKHCKKEFTIKRWRLNDKTRGQFCSQKCYHSHKRTDSHRKNISEGLKKAHKKRRGVNP